jgi:serine/threonine-protein kinase
MLALAGLGDRAGALRIYDRFARRLADELGIEPAPETRMLAGSLSARVTGEPATTHAVPPQMMAEPQQSAGGPPAQGAVAGPRPRRVRLVAVALAAAALLLVLVPLVRVARERSRPLDPRLVVVAPFRMAEADSTMGYLREGMVDLFSSRLGGAVLVAADPRTVLTAWHQMVRGRQLDAVSGEEARRLARRQGAAHLLMGSIVGPPERPTFSGRLVAVGDGSVQAAADVTGPIDSLPYLIDRLAGALLAGYSSEPPERLADLTSASLPALERYLFARDAYRHGEYARATAALRSAVALDSNFALAWLHLADAIDWTEESGVGAARRRAWELKERLPAPDRAYLEALVGPRFPEPATPPEQLAAWERVIAVTPDRGEGWYGLGDVLFHHGRFLEADSAFQGARAAFDRAVSLDSGYAAPLAHLVQIAILNDDRPAVRRLASLYSKLDSTGDVAEFLRWRVALALDDTAGARRVREQLDGFSSPALRRIITWSQLEGVGVGDGLRSIALLEARSATPEERGRAASVSMAPIANAGRFDAWAAAVERNRLTVESRGRKLLRLWVAYQYAGDWRVADTLALAAGPSPRYAADIDQMLVLSRILGGADADPDRLARTMHHLRRSPADGLGTRAAIALLLTGCCPREAQDSVDRVATDLPSYQGAQSDALLYLALAYERLGRPDLALHTLRRRSLDHWLGLSRLSQALWLEGRLASEVGDTAGAIRAWRHYLALRGDADPVLRDEVEGIRATLAAIQGGAVARR